MSDHLIWGGCDTVGLAREYGTPLYVMDEAELRSRCRRLSKAVKGRNARVCYAGKAFLCTAMARLIEEEGKKDEVMNCLLEKIMYYLNKRAAGRMEIECIVYSSKYGELAKSKGAEKWLTLLVQDQAQQI